MLISITISIGLRYCANIRPMFCQTLGENQPSWKFSLLPQNAQKQATKVEMETAAHPAIWRRFALQRLIEEMSVAPHPWCSSLG
jgi:hypothetical protein